MSKVSLFPMRDNLYWKGADVNGPCFAICWFDLRKKGQAGEAFSHFATSGVAQYENCKIMLFSCMRIFISSKFLKKFSNYNSNVTYQILVMIFIDSVCNLWFAYVLCDWESITIHFDIKILNFVGIFLDECLYVEIILKINVYL